ncbi:MAG TPA: hypothetical protein VFP87_07285 [Chitinophagaceae bacterium]|nr:hypothetical protein [Chitinophagaceae bacterium]
MKNKNLVLDTLFAGSVFFVLFILISLLFQKWPPYDNGTSLGEIVIQALVVSIVFSVVMFFYSKRRVKRHADKNNII